MIGYTVVFWLLSFVPRFPDIALFFVAVEFPDLEAGQQGAVIIPELVDADSENTVESDPF